MSMNSFHARKSRPAPARGEEPVLPRKGVRADLRLVELGLAPSRSAARRLIEAGRVMGPDGPVTRASRELAPDARLELQAS